MTLDDKVDLVGLAKRFQAGIARRWAKFRQPRPAKAKVVASKSENSWAPPCYITPNPVPPPPPPTPAPSYASGDPCILSGWNSYTLPASGMVFATGQQHARSTVWASGMTGIWKASPPPLSEWHVFREGKHYYWDEKAGCYALFPY